MEREVSQFYNCYGGSDHGYFSIPPSMRHQSLQANLYSMCKRRDF